MINYIKSENYRLLRKKGLYITSGAGFLLIIASAIILYVTGQHEANFPYDSSSFFYANVIGTNLLIFLIAFLYNLALTGKDKNLIKHSVAFGTSRQTIFWSKLIVTLSYFLIICVLGLLLMIGLGENVFAEEAQSAIYFLLASFNMLPLVLSGFFMIHAMKMMNVGDLYIIVMLVFVYSFSGDFLRAALRPISGFEDLYQYAPSSQLEDNLMNYMDKTLQFELSYWITGIVISVICLLIGARKFAKQPID